MSERESNIDLAAAMQALSYNPYNGSFFWVKPTANRVKPGWIAGQVIKGYRYISINRTRVMAHRLAWAFATGKWPENDIDHINGRRDDNRLENLREATRSQNMFNSPRHIGNMSGFKGVVRERDGKFAARIWVKGRNLYLGRFNTPEDAHDAYLAAAREHAGEFARGG